MMVFWLIIATPVIDLGICTVTRITSDVFYYQQNTETYLQSVQTIHLYCDEALLSHDLKCHLSHLASASRVQRTRMMSIYQRSCQRSSDVEHPLSKADSAQNKKLIITFLKKNFAKIKAVYFAQIFNLGLHLHCWNFFAPHNKWLQRKADWQKTKLAYSLDCSVEHSLVDWVSNLL